MAEITWEQKMLMKTENHQLPYRREGGSGEAVADCQGICLVITSSIPSCGFLLLLLPWARLYSHCSSHPAVKLG